MQGQYDLEYGFASLKGFAKVDRGRSHLEEVIHDVQRSNCIR
jgi:hypothetical protein